MGGYDAFITHFNGNGVYAWTRPFGGTQADRANDVTVESNGNIYVAGYVSGGGVDFNAQGSGDIRNTQASDIFVTQLHPDGSYGWTWLVGDPSYDFGTAVEVDSLGDIYVAGTFGDTLISTKAPA